MTIRSSKVLVIGATGRFAGLVVPELVRRGVAVRAFVRDPAKGDATRANGSSEIAIGDLRDRSSLDAALEGVKGVFYIGPLFAEDEAALGIGVVEAAEKAGVSRFTFSSVMHPAIPLEHHAAKPPVEAALQGSKLAYTILQPAVFFQNLRPMWSTIARTGRFSAPYSTSVPIGFVDYRDVAEIAAIALTEESLAYGTFELCGEPSLDRHAIAAMMSIAAGRTIEAADQSQAEWRATTAFPGSPREKDLLAAMYAYYDAHGFAGNALTLSTILGREPRRLLAYVHELAGSGAAAPARRGLP